MTSESLHESLRDAVFQDDITIVKNIIESKKIDIDYMDAGMQTALHMAAFWGKTNTVRYLIAAGANLSAKTSTGSTPLDLAIHWGHIASAQIIRFRGGDSTWEKRYIQLQTQLDGAEERILLLQDDVSEQTVRVHRAENEQVIKHKTIVALNHDLEDAKARDKKLLNNIKEEERTKSLLQNEFKALTVRVQEAVLLQTRAEEVQKQSLHACEIACEQRAVAVEQYDVAMKAQECAESKCAAMEKSLWEAQENVRQIEMTRENWKTQSKSLTDEKKELVLRIEVILEAHRELKYEVADYLIAKRKARLKAKRQDRAIEEITLEKRNAALHASKEYAIRVRAEQKSRRERKENTVAQVAREAAERDTESARLELVGFQEEFMETVRSFAKLRTSTGSSSQIHPTLQSSPLISLTRDKRRRIRTAATPIPSPNSPNPRSVVVPIENSPLGRPQTSLR